MFNVSKIDVKTADAASIVMEGIPFLNESHKERFESFINRIQSKNLLLHGVGLIAAVYIWSSDDPWAQGMGEKGDVAARSVPYNLYEAFPFRVGITNDLLDNFALDLYEGAGGYIEDPGMLTIGNLRRQLSADELFLVGVSAGIATNVYSVRMFHSE